MDAGTSLGHRDAGTSNIRKFDTVKPLVASSE
jgi:hypothetical protein